MTNEEMKKIFDSQKEYFFSGKTLDVKTRKEILKKLKQNIILNQNLLFDGLKKDLGKSESESYMTEVGLVLNELSHMIKNINKYSKKRTVKTPLAQFAAKSFQIPSPYGVVLVMSPWNYPFLLAMDPLIEAIAAGNTVILKPSRYAKNTNDAMQKVLDDTFPQEYVSMICGGHEENAFLMRQEFDYIFFTGSKNVGTLVYQEASKNLIPVTLELGGKSPCIVDETANIKLAAKRIVFGKYLNCGQTCVAPDYVYCDKKVKDKLLEEIKKEIKIQFPDSLNNDNYGKIITERHFERLNGLIDSSNVLHGGERDAIKRKIAPTIVDADFSSSVMQEEIFGPILPILTYDDISLVISKINSLESPLAMYLFSTNKKRINNFLQSLRFGGGCINDVVIHLATPYMSFGGFGASGIGNYHGKEGFLTFSHLKSIVDKKNFIDLPIRYQPYSNFKDFLLHRFLK